MKDKYEGCYIDGYKDHYAVFADNGEKLAEYDTHKDAKEDIAEWEAEVKNESYIPADTLATGYRFTIHETELLENAIKKHVEQKVDQGVNAMFDTDSEEFKKVGNEPYDKSQWWDDMKLTMRIKKTPFPRKNGYTNGDFRPNQKWLMGAIECCKSARDCDYLLKDAYLSVAHDKKLIQNLKSVRDGNPNKYVNVKVVQKWLDNGVTPEKVEKHIEWFKSNYIKGLQAKKKEFNKTQNETVTEEPMNEGLIMWGLFGVVIGISALYNRIDEAKRKKQNKKNKSTSSDNAIGITEKEINELARQAKSLKSDIITKQKSSSLYKTLYQYMTKWNTDDYVNAIKTLKSGKSIDLGLDFRTDVYYSFVEFFDLSNNDFTKQLNDPNDDDEAEKLEIKYESASFEEMKKHLSSLGFDLNRPIEGRYYSSKKYPDLIIRYVDGDDGTGIIIEPKCTLGANTFKLITEEESKKLNEDHSEISNDPEMEELMALAGVTTTDLDDLENDNDLDLDEDDPIDANTLREIDAAMDESVKSAINNIEDAEKEMNFHITQFETFNKAAQEFMRKIEKYPIVIKSSDNPVLAQQMKKDADEFTKIYEKCNTELTNNAKLKYATSTFFDKISYSNKSVAPKQLELYYACRTKYMDRTIQIMNDINNLLNRVKKYQRVIINKYSSEIYNLKIADILGYAINSFIVKVYTITKWNTDIMKYAGRTRVSLFGKRVQDSINESIGDFVKDTKTFFKNASDFLKHRKENSKSKSKDSEADIKNSPVYKDAIKKLDAFGVTIAEKVVTHLKEYATKNNFKSVYNNTAFNINDIKYCPINGYDVQVSDLQDGIDYNQVSRWKQANPEKDWQKEPQFNNEWYDKLLTEGEEFAKSLLQKDCPDIYDYYVNTGDGDEGLVYIDISLSSAYINSIKEDAKKSKNESVDTNLDILLAESAEFLLEE